MGVLSVSPKLTGSDQHGRFEIRSGRAVTSGGGCGRGSLVFTFSPDLVWPF